MATQLTREPVNGANEWGADQRLTVNRRIDERASVISFTPEQQSQNRENSNRQVGLAIRDDVSYPDIQA